MREALPVARFLMVLSSVSPLFIIWAIRGNPLIPDRVFVPVCLALVAIPYAVLWLRIRVAVGDNDQRELAVATADDHRDHLLVYLFAMLLPFYPANFATWREQLAVLAAVAFIVFIFWHLNLHYMNLVFALFRYRVFTIHPPHSENTITGRQGLVLISRRSFVKSGEKIRAYRISDTVLLEVSK